MGFEETALYKGPLMEIYSGDNLVVFCGFRIFSDSCFMYVVYKNTRTSKIHRKSKINYALMNGEVRK